MTPATQPNMLPGYGSQNDSKTSLSSASSSLSTKGLGYNARRPPDGTQYLHTLMHTPGTKFAVHTRQTRSLFGSRQDWVAVSWANDTLCFVLRGAKTVNISKTEWEKILRQDEWDAAKGNTERWVVCPMQHRLYRHKLPMSNLEKPRQRRAAKTGFNAQQQPLLPGWSSENSRPSTSSSNKSGTFVANKTK